MAKDVRMTQADYVDAALAVLQEAQSALVNLKGKLADVPGAESPAAAHAAHKAARDALAVVAQIPEVTRHLVIEAQAAEAAAEQALADAS